MPATYEMVDLNDPDQRHMFATFETLETSINDYSICPGRNYNNDKEDEECSWEDDLDNLSEEDDDDDEDYIYDDGYDNEY